MSAGNFAGELLWKIGAEDDAFQQVSGRAVSRAEADASRIVASERRKSSDVQKILDQLDARQQASAEKARQAAASLNAVKSELLEKQLRASGQHLQADLAQLEAHYSQRIALAKSAAEAESLANLKELDTKKVIQKHADKGVDTDVEVAAASQRKLADDQKRQLDELEAVRQEKAARQVAEAERVDALQAELVQNQLRAEGETLRADLLQLSDYYDKRVKMAQTAAERELLAKMEVIGREQLIRNAVKAVPAAAGAPGAAGAAGAGGGEADDIGTLARLKQGFGRGSTFTQFNKLLAGTGPILGLGLAASVLDHAATSATKFADDLNRGDKNAAELLDEAVEMVPVFGQIWHAGRQIGDVLSGAREITRQMGEEAQRAAERYRLMAESADRVGKAFKDAELRRQHVEIDQSTLGAPEKAAEFEAPMVDFRHAAADRAAALDAAEKEERQKRAKAFDEAFKSRNEATKQLEGIPTEDEAAIARKAAEQATPPGGAVPDFVGDARRQRAEAQKRVDEAQAEIDKLNSDIKNTVAPLQKNAAEQDLDEFFDALTKQYVIAEQQANELAELERRQDRARAEEKRQSQGEILDIEEEAAANRLRQMGLEDEAEAVQRQAASRRRLADVDRETRDLIEAERDRAKERARARGEDDSNVEADPQRVKEIEARGEAKKDSIRGAGESEEELAARDRMRALARIEAEGLQQQLDEGQLRRDQELAAVRRNYDEQLALAKTAREREQIEAEKNQALEHFRRQHEGDALDARLAEIRRRYADREAEAKSPEEREALEKRRQQDEDSATAQDQQQKETRRQSLDEDLGVKRLEARGDTFGAEEQRIKNEYSHRMDAEDDPAARAKLQESMKLDLQLARQRQFQPSFQGAEEANRNFQLSQLRGVSIGGSEAPDKATAKNTQRAADKSEETATNTKEMKAQFDALLELIKNGGVKILVTATAG